MMMTPLRCLRYFCLGTVLLLVLVLAQQQEGQAAAAAAIRLPLIHRHKLNTWQPLRFSSPAEALRDLLVHDAGRQAVFCRQQPDGAMGSTGVHLTPRRLQQKVSLPLTSAASKGASAYHVQMDMGTPAQKATFVMDTASDLTWANCKTTPDSSTRVQFPAFVPTRSKSISSVACHSATCQYFTPNDECLGRTKTCKYTMSYQDGSQSSGALISEVVLGQAKITMGCGTQNQGFTTAAGVLGLGRGAISVPWQTKKQFGGIFSYCLRDFLLDTAVSASSASHLILGPSATPAGMKYMSMQKSAATATYYYVRLTGIKVGTVVVPITPADVNLDSAGNGGTILDSGTSLSFLESKTLAKVEAALRKQIKYPTTTTKDPAGFNYCFSVGKTSSSGLKAPSITFEFEGGASIVAPPANYALPAEEGVRCVGIMAARSPSPSIIGALMHQNVLVQFNLNKATIGLVPHKC